MSNAELHAIAGHELDRCVAVLESFQPGTEEYTRTWQAITSINDLIDLLVALGHVPVDTCAVAADPAPAPAPAVVTPVVSAEPEKPAGNVIEVDNDYFENLRGRLTYARNERGVDTKALLALVGAANYSSLKGDGAKLTALSAALDDTLAKLEGN